MRGRSHLVEGGPALYELGEAEEAVAVDVEEGDELLRRDWAEIGS